MFYIDNFKMPQCIEEAYKEYDKLHPVYSAAVYNWKGGSPGCFLSYIYFVDKTGNELLITTRNHNSVPTENYPILISGTEPIDSSVYFNPCGFELSKMEELPKDDKELKYHLSVYHHDCVKDENGEYILKGLAKELYDFINRQRNNLNLQWLTDRYNGFLEFLQDNHPDLLKIVDETINSQKEKYYKKESD